MEENYLHLINKFKSIEIENELFSKKEKDVFYWKLMRLSIFNNILKKKFHINSIQNEKNITDKLLSLYGITRRSVVNNPFKIKKGISNIIIEHPRKIRFENENIDIYTNYFVQNLKSDFAIIQRNNLLKGNEIAPKENLITNDFVVLVSLLTRKMQRNKVSDETKEMLRSINMELIEEFGVEINIMKIFRHEVSKFRAQYKLYDMFFRKIKPKNLYLVVSYGQESIIHAAHNNKVKVIEFQHGVINNLHLGYSFPEKTFIPYFPDEIKLFGEYWAKNSNLPMQVKPAIYGYPYLNYNVDRKRAKKNNKLVVVISQGTIGLKLSELTYKLAKSLPDFEFIYKLHPGEFNRWKKDYPDLVNSLELNNVEVIEKEKNLYDIFSTSKFVIGVGSTAVYEALAFDNIPVLIKFPSYEHVLSLIEFYNLPLFNEYEDVYSYFKNEHFNRVCINTNELFHNINK